MIDLSLTKDIFCPSNSQGNDMKSSLSSNYIFFCLNLGEGFIAYTRLSKGQLIESGMDSTNGQLERDINVSEKWKKNLFLKKDN